MKWPNSIDITQSRGRILPSRNDVAAFEGSYKASYGSGAIKKEPEKKRLEAFWIAAKVMFWRAMIQDFKMRSDK